MHQNGESALITPSVCSVSCVFIEGGESGSQGERVGLGILDGGGKDGGNTSRAVRVIAAEERENGITKK